MTQVLFVGPKLPQRDQIKLHFALRVRRAKVKAALEWLIENNVLYKRKFEDKELRISRDNLDLYPEDDVPEPVIQHMILRELDSKTAAKDTSGYTRGDQDADAESDDEEMDTEHKEERSSKTQPTLAGDTRVWLTSTHTAFRPVCWPRSWRSA